MLSPDRSARVRLPAGRSQRFGVDEKLAMPFLGKPLALHVVTALEDLPFRMRVAVVSDTALDFAARGYLVIRNPDPSLGQARSLAHGVAAARDGGADAVLVALADMPRVTAAHVLRLFDASEDADTLVASSDGTRPCPPALFGRNWFPALMDLQGDQGGRELIKRGHHVVTSPAELVDIDTQEDLHQLRLLYGLEADAN